MMRLFPECNVVSKKIGVCFYGMLRFFLFTQKLGQYLLSF